MDIAFLLPWVFATAALSAVFGMAGGMVLLLVLTSRLPLPDAMVLHGLLQLVANASRMLISARHVRLDIAFRFGSAGVLTALAILAVAISVPGAAALAIDLRVVLIATGVIACGETLLGRAAPRLPQLDTRCGSFVAGTVVSALHLTSGATGPLLDAFCVHSGLDRHANVATKAAVQSIGHLLKIAYFVVIGATTAVGAATATLTSESVLSPSALAGLTVLAVASVSGTWLGRQALDRLTEASFRGTTRAIVCAVGVLSLARGLLL